MQTLSKIRKEENQIFSNRTKKKQTKATYKMPLKIQYNAIIDRTTDGDGGWIKEYKCFVRINHIESE